MKSRLLRPLVLGLAVFAASAGPALAKDCKPLQREASLPMTRLRSGHVTVPVIMMDRQVNLLFDTGGGIRSLSSRIVHELGLTAYQSRIRLNDLHGKSEELQVTVPNMMLAGAKLGNVMFLVEPSDIDNDGKRGFDGILAPDMLNHLDVELDFASMTLNLYSQDHCDGQVVYWPAETVAVIPFDLDRGKITLPVVLDGKRVTALLDTGAVRTTMDIGVGRSRFDFDPNAPGVKKGEFIPGRMEYQTQFKTLALDGITMKNPVINLIPNLLGPARAVTGSHALHEPGMPEMLLGLALLSKLHVYIAYKEHKLYMTAATPPAAGPPETK